MAWSFPLTRIAGTTIYVHGTFILLIAYVLWQQETLTIGSIFFSLLLLILVFTCVTLHELGHSITARRCGIPVDKIVLWPFGGTAHMTRQPDKPRHELFISAAGPLVNVVIAGVALVILTPMALASGDDPGFWNDTSQLSFSNLLLWLFMINTILVLFNLIPALPLDGGRILRSVLLMLVSRAQAARIMKIVGFVFAGIIGLIGIVTLDFFLLFVALAMVASANHALPEDFATESHAAAPTPPTDASVDTVAAEAHPRTGETPPPQTAIPREDPYKTGPLHESQLEAHEQPTAQEDPAASDTSQIGLFAVLNFLLAGIALLGCALVCLLLLYGIFFSGDPIDEIIILTIVIFFLGLLPNGIAFVLFLLAGIGLLRRKVWGYYTHIAAAILAALSIIGLVYTIPALIYSFKPEFRVGFFHNQSNQPPSAPIAA